MSISDIYNFRPIAENLATAGQPTAEQFAAVKEAGYSTVINLATHDSTNALAHEAEIVEGLGLRYIHIPVVWDAPQVSDAQQFFAALQENRGEKVFVHCAMNMRVSAFVYLYRTLCLGTDEALARRDLHALWEPNEVWQKFMEQVRFDFTH